MAGSSIGGNAGVASALVSWPGPSSGSATASGAGVYNTGALAGGGGAGTYTVTPSLAGYLFSPANQVVIVGAGPVTGINFTARSTAEPLGSPHVITSRPNFATKIDSARTSVMGTNRGTK